MNTSRGAISGARGLGTLRRLARPPATAPAELCDLCSAPLGEQHDHLLDPRTRQLRCACQACAILFSSGGDTAWRRTPRDIRNLAGLDLTEQDWAAFGIPTGLAFLFRSGVSDRAFAVYPSPAGPTEAEVDRESWEDLVARNPMLAGLEPDVEALLIHRLNGARDYFAVPIDECYKLTGIVRTCWRGFSGGEEAWDRIGRFFDDLRSRSRTPETRAHAEPLV